MMKRNFQNLMRGAAALALATLCLGAARAGGQAAEKGAEKAAETVMAPPVLAPPLPPPLPRCQHRSVMYLSMPAVYPPMTLLL